MKKTVFVLGAGASMGYEFPSGQGLVDRLCIDLAPEKFEEVNKLVDQELGIDGAAIEIFRKSLYYSEAVSVDLFLGKNQQFITVGKRAIANALIKYEYEQALFNKERDSKEPDKHWYRRFFNQLIRSFDMNHPKDAVEKIKGGKISFITFNYDRSLEHYVFEKMKHLYSEWPENDIIDFVEGLNIVHVYGQLGYLEWQRNEPKRKYFPKANSTQLKSYSEAINVIYEKSESSEVAIKCRKLIREAEKVVFFGIGYHKENLNLIGIDQLTQLGARDVEFVGTSVGMSKSEIVKIKRYFNHRIGLERRFSIMELLENHDFF